MLLDFDNNKKKNPNEKDIQGKQTTTSYKSLKIGNRKMKMLSLTGVSDFAGFH